MTGPSYRTRATPFNVTPAYYDDIRHTWMTPASTNGGSSSQPTFTSSLDSYGRSTVGMKASNGMSGGIIVAIVIPGVFLSLFIFIWVVVVRRRRRRWESKEPSPMSHSFRLLLNQLFDQRCVSGLRRRADHISATQRRFRPSDDHRKTHNADIN